MASERFTVTKASDPIAGGEKLGYGTGAGDSVPTVQVDSGEVNPPRESDQLMMEPVLRSGSSVGDMALYEDELNQRPMISGVINRLANYEGGVAPNIAQEGDEEIDGEKKKAPKKVSKLGTILGVYFPCIQNIFGVILFIRVTWMVGVAGWLEAFFIVLICCCTTMITAISMSAIATNGVVSGGGSYFMISRALGPEFGGAVGVLFYLGTSVASSMYIVGAVEILLQYMAPQASIFGDMTNANNAFNNYRVYGTALLFIMFVWVFLGVKFVSKFSPFALACVMISLVCIYIGIFTANSTNGPDICILGDRLLSKEKILDDDGNVHCFKNGTLGPIYDNYCGENQTDSDDCQYYMDSDLKLINGIPGMASGVFMNNTLQRYTEAGNRMGTGEKGDRSKGEIVADITSTFVILLAIFFPSVTGIMAGSNRSGDLADPSYAIPRGTIGAIATTSFVYLSCVIFFGATIEGHLLMDKFGESIGGGLIVAELAWPHPWVILIGSFLSTVGAGLQSLTGAPRLLQAIAADGVIPFLNVFAVTTKKGEPFRALLLTACISECGVLIASLDYIAPIITMFFLMCYGFVNLACALQTLLRTPNWRPRFRFYHWMLSLVGVLLCLVIMFISSWYYALVAIAIAAGIYKYIEYKGAEKEWGDGMRGLAMSAARFALLRLEEGPPHVKNWRPQLLILMKLNPDLEPRYRKMFTFSSQLKAGKGLTLVTSVLEGKYEERFADAAAARLTLTRVMKKEKVKGFAEILVASDISMGLGHMIQTSGVGGLRHNTVMVGWPYGWRHEENENYKVFIDTLHNVSAGQLAVLIPKGIDQFPENSDKMKGTIDIWWIVHDGGLLMLLPFLLTQHKVWKNCNMRIFTVAQMQDNSVQMKKDLSLFLYHLRLKATVEVIELADSDITAYTYERTLMMEQRTTMLKEMLGDKSMRRVSAPQVIMDAAAANHATEPSNVKIQIDTIPEESSTDPGVPDSVEEKNLYTFTGPKSNGKKKDLLNIKPASQNVRRMHTAVRLNEAIVAKSHEAKLVILNLPGPPKNADGNQNYMEFLEVLTEGLERVLMVRGGGREVITIYS